MSHTAATKDKLSALWTPERRAQAAREMAIRNHRQMDQPRAKPFTEAHKAALKAAWQRRKGQA